MNGDGKSDKPGTGKVPDPTNKEKQMETTTTGGPQNAAPPATNTDAGAATTIPPAGTQEKKVEEIQKELATPDPKTPSPEAAAPVIPMSFAYEGPRPKVAALVTGGLNSTLMLITLLQKGYEIYPYFYYVDGDEKMSRLLRRAKTIVKAMRKMYPGFVHRLREESIKLTKAKMDRKRREIILDVTKKIKGTGMNAIALGMLDVEDPEATEEQNEDTSIKMLQEATPVQLVAFETFGIADLEMMLIATSANPLASVAFQAASCIKNLKFECGKCENCLNRHALLMGIWGKDETVYKRKSRVWRMMHRPDSLNAKVWKKIARLAPSIAALPMYASHYPAPEPKVEEKKDKKESSEEMEAKDEKKHKKHKKKHKKHRRDESESESEEVRTAADEEESESASASEDADASGEESESGSESEESSSEE